MDHLKIPIKDVFVPKYAKENIVKTEKYLNVNNVI